MIDPEAVASGLGGAKSGTLRRYCVSPEHGLVAAPTNITPIEAAALNCEPLTAWNALYGLESRALRPGDVVLTQGIGGVSISAIQFAIAAGATVIATSSSAEKCRFLEKFGVSKIINYRKTPNWGEVAKTMTPGGLYFDHEIEVGGPGTMEESTKTVRMEAVATVIGFVGGTTAEKQTSTLEC